MWSQKTVGAHLTLPSRDFLDPRHCLHLGVPWGLSGVHWNCFHWSQNTFLPHSQYLFQFPVFTGVRPCQVASHLVFVMGRLISQQNTNLWFKKTILICSFSFPLTLKKSLQLNKKWSTHFYIFISINTDAHSHSLAHTYNKLCSPPSLLSQS